MVDPLTGRFFFMKLFNQQKQNEKIHFYIAIEMGAIKFSPNDILHSLVIYR
jgi:hypothetical protein